MRVYDIIEKKAARGELTGEEMKFFIDGVCDSSIPDYQTASFLMAVFLNGMTKRELAEWTIRMAHSGDMVDLSAIEGIKVDKHSTGGVGDKTTLVLGPIVASCGGKLAKMSGRGLGFSGGTIDKLESVPGLRTALEPETFIRLVNTVGMAVAGQTANVAPADKKLYALRDVTATVNSIPLIASSIMSKKLAAGADKILLDVKIGSGAFMKTVEQGRELAAAMVSIGEANGRETVAMLTNMDRPLGRCVGNMLELREAWNTLRGEGPDDLTELCLTFAARMLHMAGLGTEADCRARAEGSIRNGAAAEKFRAFLEAQGGDFRAVEQPERFYPAPCCRVIEAERDGWFAVRSAETVGKASVSLGAGRLRKEDAIDYMAGIVFACAPGEAVAKGQPLCTLYAADAARINEGEAILREALDVREDAPAGEALILDVVDKNSLK